MSIEIDESVMRTQALGIVEGLEQTGAEHLRVYPPSIQAVVTFSGPGDFYTKLKPGQAEHLRWMDRDRIRGGLAVVDEVAASRAYDAVNEEHQQRFDVAFDYRERHRLVTPESSRPLFVYNGVPSENAAFRSAIENGDIRIPENNIVIMDTVREADGSIVPIRHTGHQYQSLFDALEDPESRLYGLTEIATVAHNSDYVRHPYYLRKFNDDRERRGLPRVTVWAYGLRNREGTRDTLVEAELPRLFAYGRNGQLATESEEMNY